MIELVKQIAEQIDIQDFINSEYFQDNSDVFLRDWDIAEYDDGNELMEYVNETATFTDLCGWIEQWVITTLESNFQYDFGLDLDLS